MDVFKEQEKISFIEVLIELPYFAAVTFMAAISGSLMLILDAFETAGVIAQSSISFGLSRKLQSSGAFSYDYGMGKIEAFGGLISAVLLFIGLLIVLIFSIGELISPSAAGETLLWAVFLKMFSVFLDVWLYRKQLRAAKSVDSSFIQSNLINSQKVMAFDLVALLTISTAYFFRNIPYIEYVEPIICIACVVWFAYMGIQNLRKIIPDLLDKTLGEAEQLKILRCVAEIAENIKEFEGIRTRRSGRTIYIDLLATFDDSETYAETRRIIQKFDTAVKAAFPNSITAAVISAPRKELQECGHEDERTPIQ